MSTVTVESMPPSEPLWLALVSRLIRRLPVARYRVMSLVCPDHGRFIARTPSHNGSHRFVCDLHNNICRDVCMLACYSVPESSLIARILKPGMCFIDAGANWGYFTLLAAHLVRPQGKVLAFEPDPRMYQLLDVNVRMNHLRQVRTFELALADRAGQAVLDGYDAGSYDWGLSTLLQSEPHGPRFQIRTVTLDQMLNEHGIDSVDLLKMDIEGAEALALYGMERHLGKRAYRRILLELHNHFMRRQGQDPELLLRRLLAHGYTAALFDDSPIVARRAAYKRDLAPRSFLRTLDSLLPAVQPWRAHLFLTLDSDEIGEFTGSRGMG